MKLPFFIAAALALAATGSAPAWAQDELSSAELRALLEEREAAIARLEASVLDLSARLEDLEKASSPQPRPQPAYVASADRPPRGKGGTVALTIDDEAAERALERILLQQGALLLSKGIVEIAPSVNWSYSERSYPVAQIIDDTLLIGANVAEQSAFTVNLDARIGLPFGSQLELGMPYRWVDESLTTRVQGAPMGEAATSHSGGFGNLRIGLAKTLFRERGWRPDVVGRIVWDTGWGGDAEGDAFDRRLKSLTGSFSLVKRSDPVVFVGTASYRTFLGDAAVMPGDQVGFSMGAALAASPSTTLFASVSNQFLGEVQFGGERIAGSNLAVVNLNLGAGMIVGRGVLLNLVAGIGVTDDAPDYSLGLSTSVRLN